MIKLIIFDADGTLVERDSGRLLEGVEDYMKSRPRDIKLAIATNQGRPACRDAGWGDQYPTLTEVETKYDKLGERMRARVYMSLVYATRDGSMIAPRGVPLGDPRLNPYWRKPNPGMILQAMEDADVSAEQTLFVGDGKDDETAARAANVDFVWAHEFFGREPR